MIPGVVEMIIISGIFVLFAELFTSIITVLKQIHKEITEKHISKKGGIQINFPIPSTEADKKYMFN